eukprot:316826-Prorocentrum_minimum.AAC.2
MCTRARASAIHTPPSHTPNSARGPPEGRRGREGAAALLAVVDGRGSSAGCDPGWSAARRTEARTRLSQTYTTCSSEGEGQRKHLLGRKGVTGGSAQTSARAERGSQGGQRKHLLGRKGGHRTVSANIC